MPWTPGDPWPGRAGGAWSPHWGGYVRLYVRAAIEAGQTFTMGPHANDRLDAGNVLGGGEAVARSSVDRLWVDLSCDTISLAIVAGANGSQGILTKVDAGTLEVVLADPDGDYDPTNPESPYRFGARSRLVPGVPVECFAEVVDPDDSTVTVHYLFTGTADSWGEDWTPNASSRRARMTATDATKTWVRYDRPEQAPQGAGDTTAQRVARLVTFYGWPGVLEPAASSSVTLAATTLAQSGWELLGRTMDDELGVAYFTPTGALRWTSRDAWLADSPPAVTVGCEAVSAGAHDVLTDASPSNQDANLKNVIRAARTGGTIQTASSPSSVDRFGPYEYQRTDLGVADDGQAAVWATDVLTVSAYPRVVLEDVTLRAGISPTSWELWPAVLDLEYVTDVVRIVWAPPDRPTAVVDGTARVVGSEHRITRGVWETKWQLALADVFSAASIFTMGPHANDRLDAGNVLALS